MGNGGKEIGTDNKFKWLLNIGDRNMIKYNTPLLRDDDM